MRRFFDFQFKIYYKINYNVKEFICGLFIIKV